MELRVNLQHFSCKHVCSIRVEKLWILITWLHQKPTNLDLQCFSKRIKLGSVGQEFRKSFSLWNLEYVIILPKEDITGLLVSSLDYVYWIKILNIDPDWQMFRVQKWNFFLIHSLEHVFWLLKKNRLISNLDGVWFV